MAARVPKRTIEDIRFRTDIVDLVGSYIQLKRTGATFQALCPFHKEKTPSFKVNPQRQIFHCFGCGAGGDVFGFVMQFENVDFMMAVKMLAQRAGIPLEMEAADTDGTDKQLLYRIHSEIAHFYQRCLLKTPSAAAARAYLDERGLSPETVETFLIGYAPARGNPAMRWAAHHKIERRHMEEAGLVARSDRDDGRDPYYDRFRDRLMFPIRDERGRVVGFSGRILRANARAAKYVNSPETPLFRKSRLLYALDLARRAMAETREAIVCEGQIDVIRCHQHGFGTAVAAQGTAFTEDHAHALRRYADSVILVFDADTAGQDAAIKTAGTFLAADLAVRVAVLPPGEDPDSLLRGQGTEAFSRLLAEALPAVRFQVDVLAGRENLDSEAGLLRATRAVFETIDRVRSRIMTDKLLQELATAFPALNIRSLFDEYRHRRQRSDAYRSRIPADTESDAEPAPAPPPAEERELCAHLAHTLDEPEIADTLRAFMPLHLLRHASCRELLRLLLEAGARGEPPQALLDAETHPPDFMQFAAAVLMAPAKAGTREYSHMDAVRSLVLRIWQRELRRRRDALPEDQRERRVQLTYDLKALRDWETGCAVIEMELDAD